MFRKVLIALALAPNVAAVGVPTDAAARARAERAVRTDGYSARRNWRANPGPLAPPHPVRTPRRAPRRPFTTRRRSTPSRTACPTTSTCTRAPRPWTRAPRRGFSIRPSARVVAGEAPRAPSGPPAAAPGEARAPSSGSPGVGPPWPRLDEGRSLEKNSAAGIRPGDTPAETAPTQHARRGPQGERESVGPAAPAWPMGRPALRRRVNARREFKDAESPRTRAHL
mmetsp:Transcript_18798/g.55899  ORF Transcript_18798/g.55899 Transcript_18798/m.55899 type:complete len:225 (+) Transcript_18798:283-957(+)